MKENVMKCPKCGTEMNHHADKLIYKDLLSDSGMNLGGTIEEFYSCPKCGWNEPCAA
jgi:ribosomal protein S27AE